MYVDIYIYIYIYINIHMFMHSILQQKLPSSPRRGALKTCFPKGIILRRSDFLHRVKVNHLSNTTCLTAGSFSNMKQFYKLW